MLEIKQLTRLQIIRYCDKLEEENRTLKDNIEFLHQCLDDRDKSIAIMKEELSKFRDSFKKYRDYEKEELAESCYDLARENEKLKEEVKGLVERNIELDKKYTFVLSKLRR